MLFSSVCISFSIDSLMENDKCTLHIYTSPSLDKPVQLHFLLTVHSLGLLYPGKIIHIIYQLSGPRGCITFINQLSGWSSGSTAQQVQSLKFKHQYHHKGKKKPQKENNCLETLFFRDIVLWFYLTSANACIMPIMLQHCSTCYTK